MRILFALTLLAAVAPASDGQDDPAAPPAKPADRAPSAPIIGANSRPPAFDAAQAAGLSPGAKPIVLGWASAYRAALGGGVAEARVVKLSAGEYAALRAVLMATSEDAKAPPSRDPTPEMFEALGRLHRLETGRDRHAAVDQISKIFANFVAGGATSGVNQRDVDRLVVAEMEARAAKFTRTVEYRDALDDLKSRLGLPPSTPIVVDRSALDGFNMVFKELVAWTRQADRDEKQLVSILRKLPKPVDLTIDGRSLLSCWNDEPDRGPALIESATKGIKDARASLRARKRLRRLALVSLSYQTEQAKLFLIMKEHDSAFQRIQAPPAAAIGGEKPEDGKPALSLSLLKLVDDRLDSEDRLVALWIEAQLLRLSIEKDMGTLPRSWDELVGSLSANTAASEDRR